MDTRLDQKRRSSTTSLPVWRILVDVHSDPPVLPYGAGHRKVIEHPVCFLSEASSAILRLSLH